MQIEASHSAHLDKGDLPDRDNGSCGGLLSGITRQQDAPDALELLLIHADEDAIAHGLHGFELRDARFR